MRRPPDIEAKPPAVDEGMKMADTGVYFLRIFIYIYMHACMDAYIQTYIIT